MRLRGNLVGGCKFVRSARPRGQEQVSLALPPRRPNPTTTAVHRQHVRLIENYQVLFINNTCSARAPALRNPHEPD